MKIEQVIAYAKNLARKLDRDADSESRAHVLAAYQLIGDTVGRTSDLYSHAIASHAIVRNDHARSALIAMIEMHENGLLSETSLRRQAQADVIADILDQAAVLLDMPEFHPAAPAVLVGGTIEQFLRAWCEDKELPLPENGKRSLDVYATALRAADLIDKQDKKDIDSWGGTRNAAAHGKLGDADLDRDRVRLMKEGVALFLRKHDARDRPS